MTYGHAGESAGVARSFRGMMRIEGAALLAAATWAYGFTGASWYLYLTLFFVPDISLAAYLAGPRLGAIGYNLLHTTVGPLLLGSLGLLTPEAFLTPVAAIWLAHIGLDRMLGYGLKSPAGFGFTHLGPVGRRDRAA